MMMLIIEHQVLVYVTYVQRPQTRVVGHEPDHDVTESRYCYRVPPHRVLEVPRRRVLPGSEEAGAPAHDLECVSCVGM